jgi:hypothetical protein
MTDDTDRRLLDLAITRLVSSVAGSAMTIEDAIRHGVALGREFERLEMMHRACRKYSEARAAREAAFRLEGSSSYPPPRKP